MYKIFLEYPNQNAKKLIILSLSIKKQVKTMNILLGKKRKYFNYFRNVMGNPIMAPKKKFELLAGNKNIGKKF